MSQMRRLILLGAMAALTAGGLDAQTTEGPSAYVRRGDDVEASYRGYVDRLERYHARLRAALAREAPDLVERLDPAPPAETPYGYQILPTLVPGTTGTPQTRPVSTSYSWPRTQRMLDDELGKLIRDERDLDDARGQPVTTRRNIHERLTGNYEWLVKHQKLVDEHLRHNRFWQAEIHRDPVRFERQTRLHDAVVERERTLTALNAPDTALSFGGRRALTALAERLQTEIRDGQTPPVLPDLVEPRKTADGWSLRVPLYTDIEDDAFLSTAERVIEETWALDTTGGHYGVDVEMRRLDAVALYGDDPPPASGAHIELERHVGRFPDDGAVLTTGSNRTYAMVGRYVSLGPGEIRGNTLAHEFGHILGFTDRYLRGSRDLGESGYEILEIVPDPDDIMSAAGSGRALPEHFEQLLAVRP